MRKMKLPFCVLLAPNAFKGNLTALEVCQILSQELRQEGLHPISLPMGDGGDGTAEIIAHYLQAYPIEIDAVDALGRPKRIIYYRNTETAIIELAESCGIKDLKRDEYDVLNANTEGFGYAIEHAFQEGIRQFILCVGGSASIDGGLGALIQMGLVVERQDEKYRNQLIDLYCIKTDYLQEKYRDCTFTILCDVENPICGKQGAAAIFGPQKGASASHIKLLDDQLQLFTHLLEQQTGLDLFSLKYGGAAGGIALTFHALLKAQLLSGANYCLALSNFTQRLASCFAVVTGEGKIDEQSLYGKIPGTIAQICRQNKTFVYAITGKADSTLEQTFEQIFQITSYASSFEDSFQNAKSYLKWIAHDLADVLYDRYYSE